MPKPFDLKLALEGKPVITRDGREVTEVYFFKTVKGEYPICAVVECTVSCFTIDGKLINDIESFKDLFMVPEKVTKWANILQDCNGVNYLGYNLFNSEDDAKSVSLRPSRLIATVPITFEI